MRGAIDRFNLLRFEIPTSRIVGDRLVRADRLWIGALELIDASGQTGLGFCASLLAPLPPESYLTTYFSQALWPALIGKAPEPLLHQISRPRGAQNQSILFNLENAVDQALWDLAAKRAELPLYRYLGGSRSEVQAYASGLCFHLTDQELRDFYARAAEAGYEAFKIKVGHPDVEWDLDRLKIASEAIGEDGRLMVDANEAWTAKETARRLQRYAAAGYGIHWVEDPILRSDFAGMHYLREVLGPVLVNSGEYLDPDTKLAMIAADAVDIVNINDGISQGLRVAAACAAKGLPVTLGNSIMNIGAHLAAALPEVDMIEDSQLDWTAILVEPIPISGGKFVLSERPGHGLSLSESAVNRFRS